VIILDILVWLAVAKFAVLLLEDAAYAVRGKQSPRRQARARQAAAQQKTGDSATSGTGRSGSTWTAADGYLAGLIEDATERARARRRRAVARKRGTQAVNGVVVDVDTDGRWYADCDLCGWNSRPYRIEANAAGAGRDHTRTEHQDQASADTADTDSGATAGPDSAESPTAESPTAEATGAGAGAGGDEPRRPSLRVIPGGAADGERPAPRVVDPPAGDRVGGPDEGVVHADDHTYCLESGCPVCRPARFGWRCRCGANGEGFATLADAETAAAGHRCATKQPATDSDDAERAESAGSDAARLRVELYGKCTHRDGDEWCPMQVVDGQYCRVHRPHGPCLHRDGDEWCPRPARTGSAFCADHQTPSGTDAGEDQHHPDGVPMTPTGSTSTTNNSKEMHVNLEATGPEEIRAAFTQATQEAGETAETLGGIAGVLTEAADRYESLEMAASTIGHLRDAAEQFSAAHAALNSAQEELQAALADFNSKDGLVADTVTETGGNVASKEVLVG
jgi:uncharacterized protein YukE